MFTRCEVPRTCCRQILVIPTKMNQSCLASHTRSEQGWSRREAAVRVRFSCAANTAADLMLGRSHMKTAVAHFLGQMNSTTAPGRIFRKKTLGSRVKVQSECHGLQRGESRIEGGIFFLAEGKLDLPSPCTYARKHDPGVTTIHHIEVLFRQRVSGCSFSFSFLLQCRTRCLICNRELVKLDAVERQAGDAQELPILGVQNSHRCPCIRRFRQKLRVRSEDIDRKFCKPLVKLKPVRVPSVAAQHMRVYDCPCIESHYIFHIGGWLRCTSPSSMHS
jgi:hypothetical protein